MGHYSHAEGSRTRTGAVTDGAIVGGMSAHAEGDSTIATGFGAHAEGRITLASGDEAHAEGYKTEATAYGAHAEGGVCKATAEWAHAGGLSSIASHTGAFVHGFGLITATSYQAVFGEYNVANANAVFQVGNGEIGVRRSNAFQVLKDGRAKVQSAPTESDDVVRLQDISGISGGVAVVLNDPASAVKGTLTASQLSTLQASNNNYIVFNNELYYLADKQHTTGILSYTHTGWDGSAMMTKSINITISTKAWALVTGSSGTEYTAGDNITISNGKISTQKYMTGYAFRAIDDEGDPMYVELYEYGFKRHFTGTNLQTFDLPEFKGTSGATRSLLAKDELTSLSTVSHMVTVGTNVGAGTTSSGIWFTVQPDPVIKYMTPVGLVTYKPQVPGIGSKTLLCAEGVKTLFGNQSLPSTIGGNIDLYRHIIRFSTQSAEYSSGIYAYAVVISSSNLNVDSITDLKTLLGETFEYPLMGICSQNSTSSASTFVATKVTESKLYYWASNAEIDASISLAGVTITDTVTTV